MLITEPYKSVINHWVFWAPVLFAGIVILVPVQIVLDNAFVQELSQFITMLIPGVKDAVLRSTFPLETEFFLSIIFVFTPIQAVMMFRRWHRYDVSQFLVRTWRTYPKGKRFLFIFSFPLLFAVGVFGAIFVGADPSICPGCTNSNILGLVFFGALSPIAVITAGMMLYTISTNVSKILDKDSRKGNKLRG